jgi:hypothetical protein
MSTITLRPAQECGEASTIPKPPNDVRLYLEGLQEFKSDDHLHHSKRYVHQVPHPAVLFRSINLTSKSWVSVFVCPDYFMSTVWTFQSKISNPTSLAWPSGFDSNTPTL